MKAFFPLLCFAFAVFLSAPALAEAKKSGSFTLQDKIALRKAELVGFDTNKDKIVTVAELMNGIRSKFAAMDKNGDGIADKGEIEAAIEKFRATHEGVYGKSIDNQERKLRERLAAADQNGDGVLFFNEYRQYFHERYRRFDRNGNGIVEDHEYFTDVDQYPYAN